MRLRVLATVTVVAILSTACGGATDSTAPTVAPNTTFSGVFASGVERGTVTMTTGTPATGSLTLGDSDPVSLSGTFTASTSTFALTGGGFTVNATALASANATVSGTVGVSARVPGVGGIHASAASSAAGTPTLSGTVTGPGITGLGTLAAVATTAGATSTRYCGIYTGDDSGMGDFVITGSSAVASISGMGGGFAMSGTVSGSNVTLKATGGNPVNTVTANLAINGTTLSGSATSTLYPSDRVNVNASSTACQNTQPTGPYTSYVGWAGNNGIVEKLTLIPGSPATGTLEWVQPFSGTAKFVYPLSGTFNPATGAFNVSWTSTVPGGGSVTIVATAVGPVLTGTAQGGLLQSTALFATVSALGSSAALPVRRYCGSITGGTVQKPNSWNGTMMIVSAGSKALGIASWPVPLGLTHTLSGTTGGPWIYLAGGTQLFVAGNYSSAAASGTWSHVNDSKGNFSLFLC